MLNWLAIVDVNYGFFSSQLSQTQTTLSSTKLTFNDVTKSVIQQKCSWVIIIQWFSNKPASYKLSALYFIALLCYLLLPRLYVLPIKTSLENWCWFGYFNFPLSQLWSSTVKKTTTRVIRICRSGSECDKPVTSHAFLQVVLLSEIE